MEDAEITSMDSICLWGVGAGWKDSSWILFFDKDVGLVILSWIQFLFDCTNIVHTIFGRH